MAMAPIHYITKFQQNPIFKKNNIGQDNCFTTTTGFINKQKKQLFALKLNNREKEVKTVFLISEPKDNTIEETKEERKKIFRYLLSKTNSYCETEVNKNSRVHWHCISTDNRSEVNLVIKHLRKKWKRWSFKITTTKTLEKYKSITNFFAYMLKAKIAGKGTSDRYRNKRVIPIVGLGLQKSYYSKNFWVKKPSEYWQMAIDYRKANEVKEEVEVPFPWPNEYEEDEVTPTSYDAPTSPQNRIRSHLAPVWPMIAPKWDRGVWELIENQIPARIFLVKKMK